MNVPLKPIPEHDVEQGLLEDELEDDSGCICTWDECSYSGPWCRHFGTVYVISTVLCCSGTTIALFLAFLHVMNVF